MLENEAGAKSWGTGGIELHCESMGLSNFKQDNDMIGIYVFKKIRLQVEKILGKKRLVAEDWQKDTKHIKSS